jgi:hypothetical protein
MSHWYSRQEANEHVSKFALKAKRLADMRYEVDPQPCELLAQSLSYVLIHVVEAPVKVVALPFFP